MTDSRQIRGVFFDFDGVLVNSLPAHGKAWQWIMKEVGIEVDPSVAPLLEGLHSRRAARLIFDAANHEPGLNMGDDELNDLLERKRAHYREIVGSISISSKIIETLVAVKARAEIMALVTSSVRKNLNHAMTGDQQALFDHILTADSVSKNKPDPEPYLKAAEKSNLNPEQCLVVENAPIGIRSARAAGCWCVGIASTMPIDKLYEAHYILGDVTDLNSDQTWENILGKFAEIGDPGRLEPEEVIVAPIPILNKA